MYLSFIYSLLSDFFGLAVVSGTSFRFSLNLPCRWLVIMAVCSLRLLFTRPYIVLRYSPRLLDLNFLNRFSNLLFANK